MIKPKFDADALLSQTLIWLLLIGYVCIVNVFVMGIGLLPFDDLRMNLSPPWWLNLLALIIIAVTFLPVFRWVRASVRELIYSQQENPFPAMTQLNQYLEASLSPYDILPTIVETIARTLKLPFVEIQLQLPSQKRTDPSTYQANRQPVSSGNSIAFGKPAKGAALERVPLHYRDQLIGELHVSGRRAGEALSTSDRNILHDLAQQVGIALYAAQLTEDLQHARERLVIAREEERRRIRNDLHDGLAPTLSSLQLQLGAVRNLIQQKPEQAEVIINELREDMRNASAELRQLVYDLRPPMLDELGLIGAMQNTKFSSKFQGNEVRVKVIAPDPMPKLSAAVEVAVYRIASEALHNVVKHAQATECQIDIKVDGGCLIMEVNDNGKTFPVDAQSGIGLSSMKERAAELGGRLQIQPMQSSGTCVTARIPLDSGCTEI